MRSIRFIGCTLVVLLMMFSPLTALATEGTPLSAAFQIVDSTDQQRILLYDDFSHLGLMQQIPYTCGGSKTVILWRDAPLKEYRSQQQPIEEGCVGYDIGETKVYLCVDMMKQIPETARAKTMEEAANIIMVESMYVQAGSVFGSGHVTGSIPDLKDVMQQASVDVAGTEKTLIVDEPDSYHYRPLFTGFALSGLYNVQTGGLALIDLKEIPYSLQSDNEPAFAYWYYMNDVWTLYHDNMLDPSAYEDTLGNVLIREGELKPQDEGAWVELLKISELQQGEEQGMMYYDLFWKMAERLAALDASVESQDSFAWAIENRSSEALRYIVDMRHYSRISVPDETIVSKKLYIGVPTSDEMQALLDGTIAFMDEIGWNFSLLE